LSIFPPFSPGLADPGHRSRPAHPHRAGSDHHLLTLPASDPRLAGHTRRNEQGPCRHSGSGDSRTSPISRHAGDRARSMPPPGLYAGPPGATAVQRGELQSPGPPLRLTSSDRLDASGRQPALINVRWEPGMALRMQASYLPQWWVGAAGTALGIWAEELVRPNRHPAPIEDKGFNCCRACGYPYFLEAGPT